MSRAEKKYNRLLKKASKHIDLSEVDAAVQEMLEEYHKERVDELIKYIDKQIKNPPCHEYDFGANDLAHNIKTEFLAINKNGL